MGQRHAAARVARRARAGRRPRRDLRSSRADPLRARSSRGSTRSPGGPQFIYAWPAGLHRPLVEDAERGLRSNDRGRRDRSDTEALVHVRVNGYRIVRSTIPRSWTASTTRSSTSLGEPGEPLRGPWAILELMDGSPSCGITVSRAGRVPSVRRHARRARNVARARHGDRRPRRCGVRARLPVPGPQDRVLQGLHRHRGAPPSARNPPGSRWRPPEPEIAYAKSRGLSIAYSVDRATARSTSCSCRASSRTSRRPSSSRRSSARRAAGGVRAGDLFDKPGTGLSDPIEAPRPSSSGWRTSPAVLDAAGWSARRSSGSPRARR